MDLKAILAFQRLLAPVLIRGVYGVGVLVLAAVAVSLIGQTPVTATDTSPWVRIVLLLVGAQILWRVICEGLIIAFAAYERLGEILDELRGRP